MGPRWEISAETPAVFQRADFPAIDEDPVVAAEVLPGAFSVERDASGSHTDMMPTIGPQILNSDETLVGLIGTKAANEGVSFGAMRNLSDHRHPSSSVRRVKQPWWYVTKTETQAFWMGGGFAALALVGWVGAMGDRNLNAVVMAIGWTLLAAVYLISGKGVST
jgi:hypothetical protein